MACGVTKNGIVCDNPGASNHAGQHSGYKNIWGFNLRVYWNQTDWVTCVLKRALPGVRARSDQGLITPPQSAQLTATGMDLTTRNSVSGWARPTGWGARSGFTDVEIENNSLRMNGTGNVRVHLRGDATPAPFGGVMNKRLVKNGTVVQTWDNAVESDHTADVSVVDGDLIWMEVSASGGFGTAYLEANTGTYVYTEVL